MPTKLEPIELTADQRRKWIETRSAVLWKCPAFTHILFSMLNPTKGELAALFTKDVWMAATDGSNLILNPDEFFKRPLAQRVFVTAHEILHCILNHCSMGFTFRKSGKVKYADGTILDYNHQMMNMAMDYVINDILIVDKIGTMPPEGLHDTTKGDATMSFLDVYRKLYEEEQKGGKGKKPGEKGDGPGQPGGGGNGKPGQGFDTILDPGAGQGKDPGKAQGERSQAEWDTAVAAAVASAKAQGKLPLGLERLLHEVIEPTVSWQDHIRAFLARKIGNSAYDWNRPDKRLIQRDIFHPRRSGGGCGEIVVAVDTSGSIGDNELAHFMAELTGILEDVKPTVIHVLWVDSELHHVDELYEGDDPRKLKPHGGGGTSFIPPFEWIDENNLNPEALVYLTDGLGPFPAKAPAYPVLWGDILKVATFPFGDVVEVKLT